jgi:hypothetical protein
MKTTSQYRYEFDPSPAKYLCPKCRRKTLVLYIDRATNTLLPQEVGRCDRIAKCGYTFTPREYATRENITYNNYIKTASPAEPSKPANYIDDKTFFDSLENSTSTHLGQYMIATFGEDITTAVFNKYAIGKSYFDKGNANIFYRIDEHDRVRSGKIMSYDPSTGKRNKDINTWLHASIANYNFRNCFFGQHLVYQQPYKTIAIVESEKTAIIASIFLPEFIWIATGGVTGIKFQDKETIAILNDRKVIMYPDFGKADHNNKTPYDKWQTIAHDIRSKINVDITVSAILENKLDPMLRSDDIDIADVLMLKKEAVLFDKMML